jgi:hypothetical protein
MTPILLIVFVIILIALTIWDSRREESDILFWMDSLWWNVNKTENPLLYRIAVMGQFCVALIMIAIGGIWLAFFR